MIGNLGPKTHVEAELMLWEEALLLSLEPDSLGEPLDVRYDCIAVEQGLSVLIFSSVLVVGGAV